MTLHRAIMIFTFAFGFLLFDLTHGNSLSRIIGGSDATLKEHPHQVSLQYAGSHSCGGSLVAAQWVLTAAHCVDGRRRRDLKIQLNNGELGAQSTNYDLAEIHMHKDYTSSDFSEGAYPNDIAILKLSSAIDTTHGHQVIPLAETGQNFDGFNCTISGWGLTEDNLIPDQLQHTSGEILKEADCTGHWSANYNHDKHICIHNDDTGSCNGDSGGPMVCYDGTKNVLAGVTSWGFSGCRTDFPSVYARVSTYFEWINGFINPQ